jgi:hypothetical protein
MTSSKKEAYTVMSERRKMWNGSNMQAWQFISINEMTNASSSRMTETSEDGL